MPFIIQLEFDMNEPHPLHGELGEILRQALIDKGYQYEKMNVSFKNVQCEICGNFGTHLETIKHTRELCFK